MFETEEAARDYIKREGLRVVITAYSKGAKVLHCVTYTGRPRTLKVRRAVETDE